MQMTAGGSLRPVGEFSPSEEAAVLAACPGVAVETEAFVNEPRRRQDVVWGGYYGMQYAWAADADIRFRAATGGVLTALAVHLLASGAAKFILHTAADPNAPMRSRWVMSETRAQVVAASGSRYGPCAPLAGLTAALVREQPFAIVAKPCDLSAVARLAQQDARVAKWCVARLNLVCGGQSRLSKSAAVLAEYGVDEDALSVFRYRGYGNPGRTRVETQDGRAFEKTYKEMWGDESGWEIETRCKFCPDALGEAGDVASADVWAGGEPTGEDAGINGIIVRSQRGKELVAAAVDAGELVLGEPITAAQFSQFQPHQVAKKQRLAARFDGLQQSGYPVIQLHETASARLQTLAQELAPDDYAAEVQGTIRRAQSGRFREA